MTGDRISTTFSLLFALLLASACGDSGRTRDVTFQVAAPAGGPLCEQLMSIVDPCITVVAYEAGTRIQLPLRRPDDELEMEYFKLRFEGAGVTPRWDVRVEEVDGVPARIDLEVIAYINDREAIFGAFLEDIDPAAGDVSVRLYPFDEWACPGAPGEARALHGAVALNDNQVLIFGGVSGANLDPLSAREPAALGGAVPADTIELYDARKHTFTTLEIQSFDDATVFRRVLFDSVHRPGENRVRVIGGLTGPGGSPILHLENIGITTEMAGITPGVAFGSPLLPSVTAAVGRTVDLIVDATAGTVQIVDADLGTVPQGGLISVSEFFGDSAAVDPALVMIGLARAGSTSFAPRNLAYEYTREGGVAGMPMLATVRLGATAHPFDGGFVVWGGNAGHGEGSPTALTLAASALEFLEPATTMGVPIPAGAAVPMPTAFHTGTDLGGGQVLIAGGFLVNPDGRVYNQPAPSPVYFVNIGLGPTFDVRPVPTPAEYLNTIFHSATVVPGRGVALVGGASVDPPGSLFGRGNRLTPTGQTVFISGASYEGVADLTTPRWGHTTTVLSGHRLLVLGGFRLDPSDDAIPLGLEAISSGEMYYWDRRPEPLSPGECIADMAARIDAGPQGMDAALPPRVDAGRDAGPLIDAGPPVDAGPPIDAGLPVDAGP